MTVQQAKDTHKLRLVATWFEYSGRYASGEFYNYTGDGRELSFADKQRVAAAKGNWVDRWAD